MTIRNTIKQGLKRWRLVRLCLEGTRQMRSHVRSYRDQVQRRVRIIKAYFPNNAAKHPLVSCGFILRGTELSNFTYAIDNYDELAQFIAATFTIPASQAASYIEELEEDQPFRDELEQRMRDQLGRRRPALYGRRVGWYCAVRARKPNVVVETGVHDGLGSSVLLHAIERNSRDGVEGRLIGIDVHPSSGWLIPARLRSRLTLVIEDSAIAVPRIASECKVDVFIHDSDHQREHEMNEYLAINQALSEGGVILSDNAHATDALLRFSEQYGRRFSFWKERPVKHFYPGAGIGVSVPEENLATSKDSCQ